MATRRKKHTSEAAVAKISELAWKVEQLRCTAFLPTIPENIAAWWERACDEPPETTSANLREAKQRYEGSMGRGRLILQSELNRVDWVAAVQVNVEEEYTETPNMGPLEEVFKAFTSRIERWILPQDLRPIRIAFGANLVMPVESRLSGYEQLKSMLHDVTVDPIGTSDLLYQINKPRPSTALEGLMINRLQKWSVIQIRKFNLHIGIGQASQSDALISPGFHACRLELDINTPAERVEPLPADVLLPLYKELTSLGLAIAKIGDTA